jgi:outer membrane biosynthesis protein TonB
MGWAGLKREEQAGLLAALALHAGLAAALLLRPTPKPLPLPERITVNLSDVVGLTSTAPQPEAKAAPDAAPQIGEAAPPPPPPQPVARPVVQPKALPAPLPLPRPKVVPTAEAKPQAKAKPEPTSKTAPAKAHDRKVADPIADAVAAAQGKAAKKPAGASRIGPDFLKGVPAGQPAGKAAAPGAKVVGPEVKAALEASLSRQIKPQWRVPQGVDTDELVTVLTFDLNKDGTLVAAPRVLQQSGITDSNRAQAARHAEQAIRAVKLAVPFLLPPQYYDAWKHVARFRFDRKLSQ